MSFVEHSVMSNQRVCIEHQGELLRDARLTVVHPTFEVSRVIMNDALKSVLETDLCQRP